MKVCEVKSPYDAMQQPIVIVRLRLIMNMNLMHTTDLLTIIEIVFGESHIIIISRD